MGDPVVGLTHSRPVLVDHARLTADLPGLTSTDGPGRRSYDRAGIERWLTRSTAVMSLAQVAHDAPHDEIPHDRAIRPSHRAARQGRCCELDVAAPACGEGSATGPPIRFAVKGAGVPSGTAPGTGNHDNGLASLDELLQEHLVERLVAACLAAEGWHDVTTVPFYAILDAGFDFQRPDGSRTRAGLGVRQALPRSATSDLPRLGSREQRLVFETELRLRRYAVTSATTMFHLTREGPDARLSIRDSDSARTLRADLGLLPTDITSRLFGVELADRYEADRINIQYGSTAELADGPLALVDFGQYYVCERFERDLSSLTCDGPYGFGGSLSLGSPAFVQPGPLRPHPARWTKRAPGPCAIDDLLADADGRIWQGTYDASVLAREVLSGRMTPDDLAKELDRVPMIGPAHLAARMKPAHQR